MRNRTQIPIRCAALIDAPAASVRRALGRSDVWTRAVRAVGGRLDVAGDSAVLAPGGLVRFRSGRSRAALQPTMLWRIADRSGLPVLRTVPGRWSAFEVAVTVVPTAAGSLTTVEFASSSRIPLWGSIFRRRMIRYGEMLLGMTTLVAREPVRVVAGALISDGKVLLARRKSQEPPRSSDGRWELPGGKVEPGESDTDALQRELWEELALRTRASHRIGPVVEVEPGVLLLCYLAEITHDDPIVLADHDEYRWVGPTELDSFDLLESDRQFVDLLRITLQMLP